MRNIKDAYKKAHLSYVPDNEFQLKKDVGDVKEDVLELQTAVSALTTTVNQLKELVTATVSFNTDGGSEAPATQTITFGHTATQPEDPTKSNNRFTGWFKGEETSSFVFTTPITENTALKAHWVAVYTVTYDLNEGTGTLPTQDPCATGETFTVASGEGITKEGKEFGGWSDGTTTYEAGSTYTMGSANVTLTAVWNDPV